MRPRRSANLADLRFREIRPGTKKSVCRRHCSAGFQHSLRCTILRVPQHSAQDGARCARLPFRNKSALELIHTCDAGPEMSALLSSIFDTHFFFYPPPCLMLFFCSLDRCMIGPSPAGCLSYTPTGGALFWGTLIAAFAIV